MPELPEVETVRRRLHARIVGCSIESVDVWRTDVIGYPKDWRAFADLLRNRRIRSVERRGKYLIVKLDDRVDLVLHFRLSGHLAIVRGRARPRYERLRLGLGGGGALSFVEPRALGRAYAVSSDDYPAALHGLRVMGPEPISREFDIPWLAAKLKGRRSAIKNLLLDQRICCGVGNIYSDEALFRAGVRPTRRGGSLSGREIARLVRSLRAVLQDGIRWCGTTLRDRRYVQPDGAVGGFQRHLKVYGREGKSCQVCGGQIKLVRVGVRGTRFCSSCQR